MNESDLSTGLADLQSALPSIRGQPINEGIKAPGLTWDSAGQRLLPIGRLDGRGSDISAAFARASKALKQGELIKDDFFTLFESVAALEIMDPKMDSGVTLPEQDTIMESFDPLLYVLPEEIVWIMDQLLSFEMAWHDGYPLSQTLFTSLHLNSLLSPDMLPLHKIVFNTKLGGSGASEQKVVTVVLRAYCLALVKCCDCVIREVISEHFYEEEDFITANFTQNLLFDTDESSILELLDHAIETLATLSMSSELQAAMQCRLEHRGKMLKAFRLAEVDLQSEKPKLFQDVLDGLEAVQQTHHLGRPTPSPVFSERVQRFLASNTPPRPIKQIPWDEAVGKLKCMSADVIAAFTVTKLAPGFLPHALMRMTWDFASRSPVPLTYPRAVMQGILFKASSVCHTRPHLDLLLSDIKGLVLPASPLLDFSCIADASALPTSRRYRIAARVADFAQRATDEYLNLYRMALQNRCRIRRTHAQSIAILDSLQALAEEADADIKATLREEPSLLLHHDNSGDVVVGGLDEAEDDDADGGFYPLAAWVYHHKLCAMEVVLQMGFELALYLPGEELASSHALLQHVAQTRADHARSIAEHLALRLRRLHRRSFLPPRLSKASSPSLARPAPASDGGDGGGIAAARTEVASALAFASSLALQAELKALLASALAELYTALHLLGLWPSLPPPSAFSDPVAAAATLPSHDGAATAAELRLEVRLRPFLAIGTPLLPSRADLDAMLGLSGPGAEGVSGCEEGILDRLALAESRCRAAKGLVAKLKAVTPAEGRFDGVEAQWGKELRSGMFVAVGVGVGCAALRGACEAAGLGGGGGTEKDTTGRRARGREVEKLRASVDVEVPGLEKRGDPWWIVPKMTVVKHRT